MQTRLAIINDGAECGNHPRDYWYIIANNHECRPHLKINPKELDTRYFYLNGKLSQFNIIFLEQLSVSQTPKLSVLKELLAPNGSLIFYGWRPSWEDFYEQQIDIQQVFFFSNKIIFFTGQAPIANVLEVVDIQLKDCYVSPTALNELKYIYNAYEKLRNLRPHYPPLILCVLAHMEMYVELRKSREVSIGSLSLASIPGISFLRDVLTTSQDIEFNKLKTDLDNKIERYVNHDDLFDQLHNFIRLKLQQFGTSLIPDEQKKHTSITTVLETILEIISYHDRTSKRNEYKRVSHRM